MNFDAPFLNLLGTRYILEPPPIDIIRYLIQDKTTWIVEPRVPLAMGSGDRIEQAIDLGDRRCYAIALPFEFINSIGSSPSLRVTVKALASGEVVFNREYRPSELRRLAIIHATIWPSSHIARQYVVTVESNGVWLSLHRGSDAKGASISWGSVERPLVLEHAYRDGRIFRNLAALPRFWATWETRSMTRRELLADTSLDFGHETIFTPVAPLGLSGLALVAARDRHALIRVHEREGGVQRVDVDSEVPLLLNSSEKATPELRVLVDGRETRVYRVDAMFAAVRVDAGRHEVRFERRIGRGWWPVSAAGFILALALGVADLRRARHG